MMIEGFNSLRVMYYTYEPSKDEKGNIRLNSL